MLFDIIIPPPSLGDIIPKVKPKLMLFSRGLKPSSFQGSLFSTMNLQILDTKYGFQDDRFFNFVH